MIRVSWIQSGKNHFAEKINTRKDLEGRFAYRFQTGLNIFNITGLKELGAFVRQYDTP